MDNKEAISIITQIKGIIANDNSWSDIAKVAVKEAFDLAIKALEERPQDDIFPMEIVAGKCPIEVGGNCPLQPQGEWIPVSERLPEEHGYYLVTTDGSHNAVIDIAEYGKFFRKSENEYVLVWNKASRVIAWQPLPEPYKKGGAE